MPTGLSNSPGLTSSSAAGLIGKDAKIGVPVQPRAAINQTYRMIFAATGVAQVSQNIFVPPNCNVYIRAHNGQAAGNTAPCTVAITREALGTNQGDVITPDTEISYPVDNLHQIWAQGTLGDGIIISIRANSQV
jgi:hypothetical protein